MLITVSDGRYNRGNVVRLADFVTESDCRVAERNLKTASVGSGFETACIAARVINK